jgi:hypothetical protein
MEKKLTNGQLNAVHNNLGKKVNVMLLSEVKPLIIHGGTLIMGDGFRYVMHADQNPQSPFNDHFDSIHANINDGYHMVNPMRIIL